MVILVIVNCHNIYKSRYQIFTIYLNITLSTNTTDTLVALEMFKFEYIFAPLSDALVSARDGKSNGVQEKVRSLRNTTFYGVYLKTY